MFYYVLTDYDVYVQTETSALLIPMLKPWMAQFSIILSQPVEPEDPDDWSIRMEVRFTACPNPVMMFVLSVINRCIELLALFFIHYQVLKCLNQFVQSFPSLTESEFMSMFLTPYYSSMNVYSTYFLLSSY